ncbi:MAG: hypothetical protein IV113_18590 [Hydrogenophaga sp.]|nr:hypothetical protein [Hydrogenophaga sp.]
MLITEWHGVEFFVAGMPIAYAGSLNVVGLLGYEVAHLVGFERRRRSAPVDARTISNGQPKRLATSGIRCPCT